METLDVTQNGLVELVKRDLADEPRLGPVATRKLRHLQARVDGATEVAQAAVTAHQAARDVYQQAFVDYCEVFSIPVPAGPHDVEIDWDSGAVHFTPKLQ